MKTTSGLFRAAKARIPDEKHWWRGRAYTGLAPFATCMNNAVSEEYEKNRLGLNMCRIKLALALAIGFDPASGGNCVTYIIAWNDAPERTHGDVMLAFAKAIELAEADEEAASRFDSVAAEMQAARAALTTTDREQAEAGAVDGVLDAIGGKP